MTLTQLFPLTHSWLLVLVFLLAIVSIILSNRDKNNIAVVVLFFAALLLRLFMAHLDPFLHDWDERFHALVARNMMDYPLKPMMRVNTLLPYDYTAWCCNHIWLHKQPLFLWQMALSMKIFGVSEFAIRYPGVLMEAIGVLLIYRITVLLTANKRTAFIAALLTCFSYYQLELLSGYYGMDQNDVCFDFYVLASIWAYIEYRNNPKWYWVILIGLLSGAAMLTKWLTGLLVFSAWGLAILFHLRNKETLKEIGNFLIALIVSLIVFLPWQLYVLHTFPVEARYELTYNGRHLNEAVEGHSGTIWYYWDFFNIYFGRYIFYLLPAGIVLIIALRKYRNKYAFPVVAYFVIGFIFFSFIAQTKIYAYFMIVVPLGYIFMAIAANEIMTLSRLSKYLYIPVVIAMAMTVFDLPEITQAHDPSYAPNGWKINAYNARMYKNVKKYIPADVKVVINTNSFNDIDVMFFNKGIDAYAWSLDEQTFKIVKDENIRIAAFRSHNGYGISPEVAAYKNLYIIPIDLK